MYLDFTHAEELNEAVVAHNKDHPGLQMILLSDAHQHQAADIVAKLDSSGIQFFGAVFPGLLVDDKQKDQGAIIITLPETHTPIIAHLKEEGIEWETELPTIESGKEAEYSAFIFVDSQAPSISKLFDTLYHEYGSIITYFGAGAGNSDLAPAPCVFTNRGVYTDAGVVTLCATRSETSVKHGWKRIHGPFVATRTNGRIIQEINWEPAIEVYRKYLPERLHKYLVPDNASEFYKNISSYPFAIVNEGGEDIVRDIINVTADGELICISEVPQNSIMHILNAGSDNLIKAARDCVSSLSQKSEKKRLLIFDCYSRMLHLGTQFPSEIQTIKLVTEQMDPQPMLEGALALGEIASDGSRVLQFYNKTCVSNLIH